MAHASPSLTMRNRLLHVKFVYYGHTPCAGRILVRIRILVRSIIDFIDYENVVYNIYARILLISVPSKIDCTCHRARGNLARLWSYFNITVPLRANGGRRFL